MICRKVIIEPKGLIVEEEGKSKPLCILNNKNGSKSEKGDLTMVNEGRGRLFRRKDSKYLIYVPLDLAEDSMFPFKTKSSVKLKISFKAGDDKLIVEKWKEASEQ